MDFILQTRLMKGFEAVFVGEIVLLENLDRQSWKMGECVGGKIQ